MIDLAFRKSDLVVLVLYKRRGFDALRFVRPIDDFLWRFGLSSVERSEKMEA